MRRLAPLLIVLVALAACSGEDEGTGSTAAPTAAPDIDPRLVPALTQGPDGPTQEPRIGHATARRICSSVTSAFLAEAYGVDVSEQAVANAMAARLDAPDEVREAVREGCLKGFPTTAACLDSWNAPGNAASRKALPDDALGSVYVIGAAHTPALDAVDACVIVFAGNSGNPATIPNWQPVAIRVRAGSEWVGASPFLGDLMSPTAVRISAANDLESVVVVLPLQPAAIAFPDGMLVNLVPGSSAAAR